MKPEQRRWFAQFTVVIVLLSASVGSLIAGASLAFPQGKVMLDPIVSLVTSINEAVKGQLWLALMILGLSICGLIFMLGNHEQAKSRATWVLVGGAVILGASKIATTVQGVVH